MREYTARRRWTVALQLKEVGSGASQREMREKLLDAARRREVDVVLERRNYAQTTIDCYIRTVEHFSRYFGCSPDRLGPDHVRQYQVALFKKWKLAPNTVSQRLGALRFFYIQTLKKAWSVAETPYPKKVLNLPMILSQEEVGHVINSARTPFHRIVLMTLYATGVRRAELARLKISDIDSQRMVIHIRGGKGRKDRDVMLSPLLLDALRGYWRGLKRKPTQWLFPGGCSHTADRPITPKAVYYACLTRRTTASIAPTRYAYITQTIPATSMSRGLYARLMVQYVLAPIIARRKMSLSPIRMEPRPCTSPLPSSPTISLTNL